MPNSVDYNETLKRRLGLISDQGASATLAAQQAELNRRGQEEAAQRENYNSLLASANSQVPTGGKLPGRGDNLGSFINAIIGQESGGNYGSVNSSSGALGAYQILPTNVGEWSRQALGHSVSTNQFLHSPEIQNRVARYKLQEYYNRYGPAGAAVAWYAGPGTANKYVQSGGVGFGRPQGSYPSISQYVQSVLKKMGY